jgi:hypothetical protein
MSESIYDLFEAHDFQRMESDVLYKAFFHRDTSELDKMIDEIIRITKTNISGLSKTYYELSERTMNDDARISKHAYLLFGLYLTPEYAKTLLEPKPIVNPVRFRHFYTVELPKLCNQWLNGVFMSLQEFVEEARTVYVIT